MSYANRELLKSIVDFLSKETSEGSQVAVQMLRDTYQIPSEGANTINLEQVWRSGCQQLNIVDNSSDEKFKAFMKQLDSMGYFKNTTATDTYEMRYEKAKHKFQEKMKAHQQQATTTPTVDVEKAEKAKEEGNEKLKNKDFEGAVECYKEAMKFNPENHIYPSNMAAAYISLNQYEKALKCAEQSIKLNDKYVKAYQRLAQAQAKLNKKKEAVATYEKLIELNPEAEVEYRAKIDQLSTPAATSNPFAGLGGMGGGNPLGGLGGLGGMGGLGGLGDMLNNPQFMQMAMNMMQQPGMQDMMSNMMRNMGGPGGLANMFGGMDGQSGMPNFDEQQKAVMNQILEDPEVQQSDKLTTIFTAARDDPQSLMQHMSDPEVSGFMQKYARKMFGDNNPFTSMFGGAPRDDNDKHDDSNMYA